MLEKRERARRSRSCQKIDMKRGLVSIIIPTKNSSTYLETCLKRIKNQRYRSIEIILVDSNSKDIDKVIQLAKKYGCKIYTYYPHVKKGLFDATQKRNFAVKKTRGEFIYHYDADMEATPYVIQEAVNLCKFGYDAVIVKEDSFGKGPWASAKNLERRFFWGDDTVESPRFFKKKVWDAVGGYDEEIAGGGDDRDIYHKLKERGYRVARTTHIIFHNEGTLHLTYLMKKQFMYKREAIKFIRKRPLMGLVSYFPIRKSHITKWRLFASRPKDTACFIIMKSCELIAGACGILYSLVK